MASANGHITPPSRNDNANANNNDNNNGKVIVWSIAGSDSGGGAGIQADLQTISHFEAHACTVISAVTSQNSVAVTHIEAVDMSPQLDALASDMPASAIKIGLLANPEQVRLVAARIKQYKQDWVRPPLVVYDPVMVASTGTALIEKGISEPDLCASIRAELLPCIDILTPNVAEAERLSGIRITNAETRHAAAQALLYQHNCAAVVITGGHFNTADNAVTDVYVARQQIFPPIFPQILYLTSPRLPSPHHHGSGCVFSSALAAVLAQDYPIEDALVLAKAYINRGIKQARALGAGRGAVAHTGWPRRLSDFPQLPAIDPMPPFKPCDTRQLGLYPVVDSADWVEKLLKIGVKTIQLRIKSTSPTQIANEIINAVALGRHYQARVFINDYWQLAIKHQAYGVHLGQQDIDNADLKAINKAGLRLGISSHGYYEILRAYAYQPSYIAIGAIYATTTKAMPSKPQGLKKLKHYVELMGGHTPLVAIGGISLVRAADVWQQQPGCLAVVTAITEAADYRQAVKSFFAITGELAT